MYGNKANFRKKSSLARIGSFFAMAAAFLLLIGGIVTLLWNAILPDLLGVKPIKFWQAIGLLLLFRLLIGGIRFGLLGKKHPYAKRKAWREKWMNMSHEERKEFKSRWKERCKQRKENKQ